MKSLAFGEFFLRWGWGFFRYGTAWFFWNMGIRSFFLYPFLIWPPFLHTRSLGARLVLFFQSAGVLGLKIGQILSLRPDIVGVEIAKELSCLQDRVPPFGWKQVRKIVEKQFGKPLEAVFRRFDQQSSAAASVAQVHYAELLDGSSVAIKIIRPQIRRKIAQDLASLRFLSKGILIFRKRHLKRFKFLSVLDLLESGFQQELDLRFEAAAMEEMADHFRTDSSVIIPKVYWPYTGRDVLVLQWVEGLSTLKGGFQSADLARRTSFVRRMAVIFFKMVYEYGFFHADWHPGNILIGSDDRIIFLDFGLTGRLSEETRYHLADMMGGFFQEDYKRAAEAHLRAGWVPPQTDMGAFSLACRFIARPVFRKQQKDISIAHLLTNLFEVTAYFSMETQESLLLLQKTLLQLEGLGRALAPEENIWFLAGPLIEEHFKRLQTKQHLRKILGKFSLFSEADLAKIPQFLKKVILNQNLASLKAKRDTFFEDVVTNLKDLLVPR